MRQYYNQVNVKELIQRLYAREEPAFKFRIEEEDAYFRDVTRMWARILNDGVSGLPDPPWLAIG